MSLPVVLDVSTNPRGPLDCVGGEATWQRLHAAAL